MLRQTFEAGSSREQDFNQSVDPKDARMEREDDCVKVCKYYIDANVGCRTPSKREQRKRLSDYRNQNPTHTRQIVLRMAIIDLSHP